MQTREATSSTIQAENKPATVAAFASKMKRVDCDLAGLWGWGQGAEAGIIALPKNAAQFREAAKNAGDIATESRCFQITGEDKVGVFADSLERIANDNISLQAVDAMAHNARFTAVAWPESKDADTVGTLLKSNGLLA